jgi:hypothetical protein
MSNKFQARISNARNFFIWNFEFWSLEFVWDLACLRVAASAKAGACDLVLTLRIMILAICCLA